MRLLALETSTESGSCALMLGERVIERACPAGQSHSETLLPLVGELLAEGGISARQLDAIAFGAGPGAFTGLRVACGAAQGLAVAIDCPVVLVSGLEALAEAAGAPSVLSLLDARMGEIYAAAYIQSGQDWHLAGEQQVLAPDALTLPESGEWTVCGNALSVIPGLAERLAAAGLKVRADIKIPQARTIARIAARRFLAGQGMDAAEAAPLYVRDKVAKTVAERLLEGGRA